MDVDRHFSPGEKHFIKKAFFRAEKLGERYFNLLPKDWERHRYDVKTLAFLKAHEVKHGTFAHLCKYAEGESTTEDNSKGNYFYRICLQDNYILEAVDRGGPFIKLSPLMLYIATHELVHIVRFDTNESAFDMPLNERISEEEKVHAITRRILDPVVDHELNLVFECFSNNFLIKILSN